MQKHKLNSEECRAILEGIKIPPQPNILIDFNSERNKEEPNIRKISKIIVKDTALSAGILKTVNSSFYGLRRTVASIQQAIPLLGLKNVSNLVLSFALKNTLSRNKSQFFTKFWEQSNAIALISAKIAKDFSRIDPDEAYTLGLMCDCGVPLIAERFPDYEEFYMENLNNCEVSITDLEDETFATDHAFVGAFLTRTWNLPSTISFGIEAHHSKTTDFDLAITKDNVNTVILLSILLLSQRIYNHYLAGRSNKIEDGIEWSVRGLAALETLDIEIEELDEIETEYHALLDDL